VGLLYFCSMASDFTVRFLGTGSAIPMPGRHPTAQWVSIGERHYLVDCGEGTQMQIRKFHLPMQRLSAIFISHMHADHFLGLPGLLSTLDLLDFKKPLTLVAPAAVFAYLDDYAKNTGNAFRFPIHRIPTDAVRQAEPVFEDKSCTVTAFALHHSIDCHGFLFKEQPKPLKIRRESIAEFGLSHLEIQQLKAGISLSRLENVPAHLLTMAPAPPRTYAFMTDTRPLFKWADLVSGADVLYHEATFTLTWKERADQTGHSTAEAAAKFANAAKVKQLYLGHFSSRYSDLTPFLEEATPLFPNTFLAFDGLEVDIYPESITEIPEGYF
jgi:ribonuclease Z